MLNSILTESYFSKYTRLTPKAQQIRDAANFLCDTLCRHFSRNEYRQSGLAFTAVDNTDILYSIATPFRPARIRLDWRIEENELIGLAIVERRYVQGDGVEFWQPVYEVLVPSSTDNPIVALTDGGKFQIQLRTGSDEGHYLSVQALGLSIYRAIINGPEQPQ